MPLAPQAEAPQIDQLHGPLPGEIGRHRLEEQTEPLPVLGVPRVHHGVIKPHRPAGLFFIGGHPVQHITRHAPPAVGPPQKTFRAHSQVNTLAARPPVVIGVIGPAEIVHPLLRFNVGPGEHQRHIVQLRKVLLRQRDQRARTVLFLVERVVFKQHPAHVWVVEHRRGVLHGGDAHPSPGKTANNPNGNHANQQEAKGNHVRIKTIPCHHASPLVLWNHREHRCERRKNSTAGGRLPPRDAYGP